MKNWLVDIWENNIKYEKLIKLNYNSAAQSQKKEVLPHHGGFDHFENIWQLFENIKTCKYGVA